MKTQRTPRSRLTKAWGYNEEFVAVIKEWCNAMNVWHEDLSAPSAGGLTPGGGFPKVVTREDLYFAGRKLFEIAGIEPHPYGVYKFNNYCERGKKRNAEKTKTAG